MKRRLAAVSVILESLEWNKAEHFILNLIILIINRLGKS